MLQPNVEMTWAEMREKYPDRWVFVDVTDGEGLNFKKGIVRYVTTDNEKSDVRIKCIKENVDYIYKRTTLLLADTQIIYALAASASEGTDSKATDLDFSQCIGKKYDIMPRYSDEEVNYTFQPDEDVAPEDTDFRIPEDTDDVDTFLDFLLADTKLARLHRKKQVELRFWNGLLNR